MWKYGRLCAAKEKKYIYTVQIHCQHLKRNYMDTIYIHHIETWHTRVGIIGTANHFCTCMPHEFIQLNAH